MSALLSNRRAGFGPGVTSITALSDPSGIATSVLKLAAGEERSLVTERETAWLLMSGAVDLAEGSQRASATWRSLFDEGPSALHVSNGAEVKLSASEASELLVFEAANPRAFAAKLYTQVKDEHRGKGKVQDAAYRFVRTVFDATNAPAEAELVLGEVINFPGRWYELSPHLLAPNIHCLRCSQPCFSPSKPE